MIFLCLGSRAGVILNFPQTELALWGSGALKAGGTADAPERSLGASFSSQNVGHSNFANKKLLWLENGGPPHAVLQPQVFYFRKVAVARELDVF